MQSSESYYDYDFLSSYSQSLSFETYQSSTLSYHQSFFQNLSESHSKRKNRSFIVEKVFSSSSQLQSSSVQVSCENAITLLIKYHEWQKKRNSTKAKDLDLTFDRLYEKHYSLKQIQEFQDANWKKNHIQKRLEERLKVHMKVFYKKRKKKQHSEIWKTDLWEQQRLKRKFKYVTSSSNGTARELREYIMIKQHIWCNCHTKFDWKLI